MGINRDGWLAAAETVDTRLVAGRLTSFSATHREYIDAQRVVEAAERDLATAAALVRRCDADQDASVDLLARAFAADGQPHDNPFRAFGVRSPALLQRCAAADDAKAIHRLVAAVQRIQGSSSATLQVAQAADAAASAVEQALAALQPLQAALHTARLTRDAIGQHWDRELAALGRKARCAADDGAPHLHAALFRGVRRKTRKASKRAVTPPEAARS